MKLVSTKTLLGLHAILISFSAWAAQPNVVVLATGGAIAGAAMSAKPTCARGAT